MQHTRSHTSLFFRTFSLSGMRLLLFVASSAVIAYLFLVRVVVLFEHYPDTILLLGRAEFSQLLLGWLSLELVLVLGIFSARCVAFVREFFNAPAAPINLAVCRIVLFVVLLCSVDGRRIVQLSTLPQELIFTPLGLNWFVETLPIYPEFVSRIYQLFLLSCITAILGVFFRCSAIAAFFCGYYLLAVSALYTAPVAYGFLLLFALILGTSRAADVFALDALVYAVRRARHKGPLALQHSSLYGRPLRFLWTLAALYYFVPIVRVLWEHGFVSLSGENSRLRLFTAWFMQGGIYPQLRVDTLPLFCSFLGYTEALFATALILCFWSERFRLPLAVFLMIFQGLKTAVRASFSFALDFCLLFFVPWDSVFAKLGQTLWKDSVYAVYDGNALGCSRLISALRVFDVCNRIIYIDAAAEEGARIGRNRIEYRPGALYVVRGESQLGSLKSLSMLLRRTPILWPLLLFLHLTFVSLFVQRKVLKLSEKRRTEKDPEPGLAWCFKVERFVSVYLVPFCCVVVFYCGISGLHVWPLSSPAPLAVAPSDLLYSLSLGGYGADRTVVPIDKEILQQKLGTIRFYTLSGCLAAVSDREEKIERFKAWWNAVFFERSDLDHLRTVQFFRDTYSTLPELRNFNPVDRKLLMELRRYAER